MKKSGTYCGFTLLILQAMPNEENVAVLRKFNYKKEVPLRYSWREK
jgi:hypothetical protein